jgi:methyl-accepting chemotaxis protein
MHAFLTRFNIRTKLFALVVLSVLSLLVVGTIAAVVVRQTMVDGRVASMRAVVEAAYGIAERLEHDVTSGRLTHEQALERFRETVHGMRYNGGADYLMAYDKSGFNIAHGADAKLEGTDRSQAKDPTGKLYIQELMDVAAGPGEGSSHTCIRGPAPRCRCRSSST